LVGGTVPLPNFIASFIASAVISFGDMSWPMISVKSSFNSWYLAESELLSGPGVVVGAGGYVVGTAAALGLQRSYSISRERE
jgi:hypothetical protein